MNTPISGLLLEVGFETGSTYPSVPFALFRDGVIEYLWIKHENFLGYVMDSYRDI